MAVFGPYPARVVEVHDGDTIDLDIDLGFDHMIVARGWDDSARLSCRIYGINAPELKTTAGNAARDFAQTLLKPGDLCKVTSHGWDKFGGRFDGSITLADGRDFAQVMLSTGHARVMKI
jgi:endonuclease YncB( thermonuclease family)